MRLEQKIKFWVARDDGCMASDCFGVEPQNDWFEVQYYPEQINGVVVWNKGLLLAQHIYKGYKGEEMRGKVFDISKNGIRRRIKHASQMLEHYNMTVQDFFDDPDITGFDCFFDIVLLD